MSDEKRMTRREALKKMGAVADGIGLGIGGVYAIDALETVRKRRNDRSGCPHSRFFNLFSRS